MLISKCFFFYDFYRMIDWYIVEVEVWGFNGFNVKIIRSNFVAVGAVIGIVIYVFFFSSMLGRLKDFLFNIIV